VSAAHATPDHRGAITTDMPPAPLLPASDAARIAAVDRLSRWFPFAGIFAPAVLLLLLADAVAHGATSALGGPALQAGICVAVIALAFTARRRWPRIAGFFRYFTPLLLYGLFYTPMHALLASVRPRLIDTRLAAVDRALFGTDPIAWLAAHAHPLLVDVLILCYATYYVTMPALLLLLWWRHPEAVFRRVLSAMTIAWYGALVSYALFPALGPLRHFAGALPPPRGWLPSTGALLAFLRATLPAVVRDCVPSMHTAVTLLTLAYARRFSPRFFRVILLPSFGLIAATMVIQQHYVIDVLLGIPTAAVLYAVVERFRPE
jgi:hypothetical protein